MLPPALYELALTYVYERMTPPVRKGRTRNWISVDPLKKSDDMRWLMMPVLLANRSA